MRGQGAGHKPKPAGWTPDSKKTNKVVHTTTIQPIPVKSAESKSVVVKIIPAPKDTTETVTELPTETTTETTSETTSESTEETTEDSEASNE